MCNSANQSILHEGPGRGVQGLLLRRRPSCCRALSRLEDLLVPALCKCLLHLEILTPTEEFDRGHSAWVELLVVDAVAMAKANGFGGGDERKRANDGPLLCHRRTSSFTLIAREEPHEPHLEDFYTCAACLSF